MGNTNVLTSYRQEEKRHFNVFSNDAVWASIQFSALWMDSIAWFHTLAKSNVDTLVEWSFTYFQRDRFLDTSTTWSIFPRRSYRLLLIQGYVSLLPSIDRGDRPNVLSTSLFTSYHHGKELVFLILARHAISLHSTENTISNSACHRYHGCMFRSPYDPRSQKEIYLNGGSICRYSNIEHGVVRHRYTIVVLTTNNTVSFFCPVVEMQQRLTGIFLPEMLLVPTSGSVRTPYDGRPTTSSQ